MKAMAASFVFVGLLLMTAAVVHDGISDRASSVTFVRERCETRWSRYEYVFPAYRLGCWLGERT